MKLTKLKNYTEKKYFNNVLNCEKYIKNFSKVIQANH